MDNQKKESKNTTIAISKEIWKHLQAVKHKLEKENNCSYSFGGTVQYLIEKEEKNGPTA